MTKKKLKPDDKEQSERFKKDAQKLEADMDPKQFEEAFKTIAKQVKKKDTNSK